MLPTEDLFLIQRQNFCPQILIKMGKTVSTWSTKRMKIRNSTLNTLGARCLLGRHSNENIEEVGYMSLKFKGKVQAGDKYLDIIIDFSKILFIYV